MGRILHGTKNLREAGAPFEAAVRRFFARFLPAPFVVDAGYLFDTASNCTPQIDMFIADAGRLQIMLRSPEGAAYAPFTDAYALTEVKNGGVGIGRSIEQLSARLRRVSAMRQSLAHATTFPGLCSALIVGNADGVDESEIIDRWETSDDHFPTFILLLSKGELIMPDDFFSGLFGPEGEIHTSHQPIGQHLAAYALGEDGETKRGNALMFLFYSILHRLRACQAHEIERAFNHMHIPDVTNDEGPKRAARHLSSVASPFAAAMLRDFRLRRVRLLG